MKRNVMAYIAVLLIVLLMLSGCSAKSGTDDAIYFQDTVWGMTEDEVIAVMGKPGDKFEEGKILLIYSTLEENGDGTVTMCNFNENDELYHVTNSVVFKDSNSRHYIDAYDEIKSELTKLYGEPSEDTLEWSDEQYKDDKANYGRALEEGHLSYTSTWEKGNTIAKASLHKGEDEIGLLVLYLDRERENVK